MQEVTCEIKVKATLRKQKMARKWRTPIKYKIRTVKSGICLDTEFDLNARQNEEIWIKMKQWLMQLSNQDV